MDRIPVLPDGQAVAGVQIPGGLIVLAKMLIYVKNLSVTTSRKGGDGGLEMLDGLM